MSTTDQSTANWKLGKSNSTVVSDIPTHIKGQETGHSDIDNYGGYLVGESIPSSIAQQIVDEHNIVKELRKITEHHRDRLCDVTCSHLDALIDIAKILRIILNQINKP